MQKKDEAGLSRREVLAGVSMAAGLASVPALGAGKDGVATWDQEADVVVVGGGAAGRFVRLHAGNV